MNPRWMRKRPIVFRRRDVTEDKVTGDLTETGPPTVWTLHGQFVVGSERQINMAPAGDSPRADGRCTFFAADVEGKEPQVGDEITEVNGVTCDWMVTDVQRKADFNHLIVKFARPESTNK
ncbi:MAG: hypothetical protein KJ621_18240 [Proteobacteria bacterium]|nr:hypothetical protein [Pseudomonadota bacterium]MBU1742060.1 hypothetical protein [Pseudomonadota bacterium]